MGLFDGIEIDFDGIKEFTAGLPAGKFPVMVAAVESGKNQSTDSPQIIITYAVTEGDHAGKSKKEFLDIVGGVPQDRNQEIAQQVLKTRLKSFGIPDSQLNSVEPDDIVGTTGVLTLKENKSKTNGNTYVNVSYFTPENENAPTSDLPTPAAESAATSTNPFENPFAK